MASSTCQSVCVCFCLCMCLNFPLSSGLCGASVYRNLSICLSVSLGTEGRYEEMLCPACGVCRRVQEQGCSGAQRNHSKGPHCLCKAGHLLSWFCFSSSQWAPDPPCKQREFKNCSPSCVPKCSECCGELERRQLGYPALPLQQEATSPLAATTHLCNMPQRKETKSSCKGQCTPHQELVTHLPWEWEACARHSYVL